MVEVLVMLEVVMVVVEVKEKVVEMEVCWKCGTTLDGVLSS